MDRQFAPFPRRDPANRYVAASRRPIEIPDETHRTAATLLLRSLRGVARSHPERHPSDPAAGAARPGHDRPEAGAQHIPDHERGGEQALVVLVVTSGMVSELAGDGLPKYVWSVDADGTAYEAKLGTDGYHGYRLEDEDDMRSLVLKEWKKRGEPADD